MSDDPSQLDRSANMMDFSAGDHVEPNYVQNDHDDEGSL